MPDNWLSLLFGIVLVALGIRLIRLDRNPARTGRRVIEGMGYWERAFLPWIFIVVGLLLVWVGLPTFV